MSKTAQAVYSSCLFKPSKAAISFGAATVTLISSAISYALNDCLCHLTGRFRAKAPTKPDYSDIYTSDVTVVTQGDCDAGSYLEIHQPTVPYRDQAGKVKAIIYLHGFSLGPSRIYGTHIEHLVKQGYYVFYPNFQTGFCHFEPDLTLTVEELIDAVFGEKTPALQYNWLKNAMESVRKGFESIHLDSETAVDTYVFGHSLGGLFAISWPYFINHWQQEVKDDETVPTYLIPQQIVTADPIPSSVMIPGKIGRLIETLIPQVDVHQTGSGVTMPLVILHGRDDAVVAPSQWDDYFDDIATPQKSMFLSSTDAYGCSPLYANHEQATVDTSFFPTSLSLLVLDGVGAENALNWNYIWPPLDRAIRNGDRVDLSHFDMGTWSDGHPVQPIQLYKSTSLPKAPSMAEIFMG